jgi:membrane-anchored glycerophosphoryl diester phosphodiesterase (GDPDase)
MTKNTTDTDTIKQIKQARKDKFQHSLRVFGLSVWYTVYGLSALVVTGLASYALLKWARVDANIEMLLWAAIAVTITPVAHYIGLGFFRKGIVGVLRELAEKEGK